MRPLPGPAQPLFGVFGQQVAQRDVAALGLGGEPLSKITRKDDHAAHTLSSRSQPSSLEAQPRCLLSGTSAAASLAAT